MLGAFIYDIGKYTEFKDLDSFLTTSFWAEPYYKFPIMYGMSLGIILPLCLLKDISKMRVSSIFGVFTLMSLVIIIVAQSPWYIKNYWENIYKEDDPKTHLNLWDVGSGFNDHFYFFKGTATLFYAYSCHIGAFPIYKTLKNNVMRRITKVFARSILLDAAFYVLVGVTGYLSMPLGTPDLIIERYKYFNSDIIMSIGRIALVVTLIMKIPANYNSFRLSFLEVVWGTNEMTNKMNYLITVPTIIITVFIGAIYGKVTDYISLLGGFCSVIISFIIPGMLYCKSNEYPIKHWKNVITIVIVSILSLIGFTSGIMTIVGMIRGN